MGDGQGWSVWLGVAVAMLALVVAASAGSVRIWSNPEPTGSSQVQASEPTSAGTVDDPLTERSPPAWIGDVLRVVAVGVFVAVLAGGVVSVGRVRPGTRRWRWLPVGRRPVPFAAPLPDAVDPVVRIDAEAARTSLRHGAPRNAIVACWMTLEQGVAEAGVARRPAETSSEYAERIVAGISVDPGPVTELAALFREARFSVHELGDGHRERAEVLLDQVIAALATGAHP